MPAGTTTQISIRYADLDAQGHLNNARYVTFAEQARMEYLQHLGLWDGKDFLALGLIVADVHVAFKAPAFLGQMVRIHAWVSRLGNKSLTFEYTLENAETGQLLATVETVMVSYDYHRSVAIPIPAPWRETITAYEGLLNSGA
jgi:acyl-CoA thioester hydrolase